MDWTWIYSMVEKRRKPVRKLLTRNPLYTWHILLASGLAIIFLAICLFPPLWVNWHYTAWLATICIILVATLLCTMVWAALHGYHLYKDRWVKGIFWLMIVISLCTIGLAYLYAYI